MPAYRLECDGVDGLVPGTYDGCMSMSDLAWAAGFFDGEGCVSRKSNGTYRLIVQQNMREPLDVLESLFGGRTLGPYTRRRSRDPNTISNPYWVWRLTDQEQVLYALDSMSCYFRVKGQDADRAVEAIRERFGRAG